MTVFAHAVAGGGGKQVFPVDYEAEVSQRLLDFLSSADLKSAEDCVADPFVDVNFVGTVTIKLRRSEVVIRDDLPNNVSFEYEEFKTDVTALLLAVHFGNVAFVRKLLSVGADVNQKLFRGYATTAAVRNGHLEVLQILIKAGASQPACEEALFEASCHGRARFVELLMGSDLIRPHVAVHAFVTSCCRGFTDVVDALLKCGVDMNANDRVLLQSSNPSLYANVDCNAVVAAVVSRQVSVVHLLLQAGVRTDIDVKLGAWSWDTVTGEEFRVGAGLAEPYPITWCAVEYFEVSGAILRALLKRHSPNTTHRGRTLLHHAILCGNARALNVLLDCGANTKSPVKTTTKTEFHPMHMAARLGLPSILERLIKAGCDLNSRTDSGDTALMICARYKREECLGVLARAGADFGLVNNAGSSVDSIAMAYKWSLGFQQAFWVLVKSGKIPLTTDLSVFSPLLYAARVGDIDILNVLVSQPNVNLDHQDDNGFTAVLVAAQEGHVDVFKLLVYAGADVNVQTKSGDTVITLSQLSRKRDQFEEVMLEYALEIDNRTGRFYALHCAARRGDMDAVRLLTSKGYDVNVPDEEGYTPLMLAAREGHSEVCRLLISKGSCCEFKNSQGETALSLARKNNGKENGAECAILDELARQLVVNGSYVKKHTKGGKGNPHDKPIRMVEKVGVLQWGKSSRRKVVCKEAEVGPSGSFRKNRRHKGDADEAGVFRVVTTRNKEVHFVCEGGRESAKLWVRGIKLLTKECTFGRK